MSEIRLQGCRIFGERVRDFLGIVGLVASLSGVFLDVDDSSRNFARGTAASDVVRAISLAATPCCKTAAEIEVLIVLTLLIVFAICVITETADSVRVWIASIRSRILSVAVVV